MPSTRPLTPWIFQVFMIDLVLVLTIEMVLSPESAATSAACAATALKTTAADAANNVRNFIALSLCYVARLRRREGYGADAPAGCGRADNKYVRRLHPNCF